MPCLPINDAVKADRLRWFLIATDEVAEINGTSVLGIWQGATNFIAKRSPVVHDDLLCSAHDHLPLQQSGQAGPTPAYVQATRQIRSAVDRMPAGGQS